MRGLLVIILVSLLAIMIVGGGVDNNGFPTQPNNLVGVQTAFDQAVNNIAFATLFGGATSFWLMVAFGSIVISFFRSNAKASLNSAKKAFAY